MASHWPSFTRQKLFLASTLFRMAGQQDHANGKEAAIQGGIALLEEARRALLKLIADTYQIRDQSPATLDALADCLAGDRIELDELRALATQPGSWWHQLEQLTRDQNRPGQRAATAPVEENLIAVAAQTGPDRTIPALLKTADGMKHYMEMILERHDEW